MLLRATSIAVLAFAFSAAGQDPPQTPKPEEEKKEPSLDTDRWLRREPDLAPRKRSFIVTPELRVTPNKSGEPTRAEDPLAQNADGKCSIPLREVNPPDPNGRIKVTPVPPTAQGKFHMKFLKPPAPPCNQADRRSTDSQPPKK